LGEYGTLPVTITRGAWLDVCKTSVRVYGRIRFTAFTRSRNETMSVCMILTFLSTSILCFLKAKSELHLYMQSWYHRCTESLPERRHCPKFIHYYLPSQRSETLPLPENAPPRTPIRQHQSPPSAPLPNLDDRLPNASIAALTRTNRIITFPHES
jgi:hypothetical protein